MSVLGGKDAFGGKIAQECHLGSISPAVLASQLTLLAAVLHY